MAKTYLKKWLIGGIDQWIMMKDIIKKERIGLVVVQIKKTYLIGILYKMQKQNTNNFICTHKFTMFIKKIIIFKCLIKRFIVYG